MEHPICDLLKLSNESLKNLINVNAIVGNAVKLENNITVIPISRIKCSFVAGGTEFEKNKNLEHLPFGGATGGNVNIIPIAFLVVNQNDVKILHLENNTHLIEKVVDEIPEFIEKIKSMFTKNIEVNESEIEKKVKI
jgi:sporulation protein YtfJ